MVPVGARLSQLENPKLWAFPDDICSFSNTHLASLVPCSAMIVQSQLGRFFTLWNLYIFHSDISEVITEAFLSGWFIVKQNHSHWHVLEPGLGQWLLRKEKGVEEGRLALELARPKFKSWLPFVTRWRNLGAQLIFCKMKKIVQTSPGCCKHLV